MAHGTIIIAAHNEESVIGRTLDGLGDLLGEGDASVIVVCNGCTDKTATIARTRAGVVVVELAEPSKTAALRAGDSMAETGPRIYLDADVVLSSRAARDVFSALDAGAVAGRPPHTFDVDGADWAVRSWYRVRKELPSISGAMWGAGCYALSEQARSRFAEFPELISDDLFIDNQFRRDEIVIVDTDAIVVTAPRRVADLLRIMQRSYRTQREVPSAAQPGAGPGHALSAGQRDQLRDLVALVGRSPATITDVLVYLGVIALARFRARHAGADVRWERDTSSRAATPTLPDPVHKQGRSGWR